MSLWKLSSIPSFTLFGLDCYFDRQRGWSSCDETSGENEENHWTCEKSKYLIRTRQSTFLSPKLSHRFIRAKKKIKRKNRKKGWKRHTTKKNHHHCLRLTTIYICTYLLKHHPFCCYFMAFNVRTSQSTVLHSSSIYLCNVQETRRGELVTKRYNKQDKLLFIINFSCFFLRAFLSSL